MANIDCVLDTEPMANSIDNVSRHVGMTTTAVTAMQAAVIAAEKESSDKVCQNVNRGFYSLINSQLTSKKARYFTEMNARFTLLLQYSRSLQKAVKRLEEDVNRLQKQYYKIFHGIDRSLERRIAELDNASIELGSIRKSLITDQTIRTVGATLITGKDGDGLSSLIVTANLKDKTGKAIDSITRNVRDNKIYKRNVDKLIDEKSADTEKKICVPVLIAEEQSQIDRNASVTKVSAPDILDSKSEALLQQKVMEEKQDYSNNLHSDQIRNAFMNLLNQSGLDQRTAETIRNLYEKGAAE